MMMLYKQAQREVLKNCVKFQFSTVPKDINEMASYLV